MARLTAPGGYGLWRLSSSHSVGEIAHGDRTSDSDDPKSRDAKMSSSSDMMVEVREAVAASIFARHWETMLNLERTTSGHSVWLSLAQAITESRSSWITMGLANGMAG